MSGLQQLSRVSNQSDSANGSSRTKRGRACIPCKAAHLSCDESRPCRRCISREMVDQCQDAEKKRRRTKNSAGDDLLQNSTASGGPQAKIQKTGDEEAKAAAEFLATSSRQSRDRAGSQSRIGMGSFLGANSVGSGGMGGMAYMVPQTFSQISLDMNRSGMSGLPFNALSQHTQMQMPMTPQFMSPQMPPATPMSATDDNLQLQDLLNLIIDGNAEGHVAQALVEPELDTQSHSAMKPPATSGQPGMMAYGNMGSMGSMGNMGNVGNMGVGPGGYPMNAGFMPGGGPSVGMMMPPHAKMGLASQFQENPLDTFQSSTHNMQGRVTAMKAEIIRFFHSLAVRLRSVPNAKDRLRELQVDAGMFWQKILPRMINKPISFDASQEAEKFRLNSLSQSFKDLDLPTCVCTHYGVISSANMAFCELVGKTRDALNEKCKFRMFDFIHDDDIVDWIRHQIRTATNVSNKQSYRMRCKVVNKSEDSGHVGCVLTATFIKSLQFGEYLGTVFIFTPLQDI